jgi:hypothetical protein
MALYRGKVGKFGFGKLGCIEQRVEIGDRVLLVRFRNPWCRHRGGEEAMCSAAVVQIIPNNLTLVVDAGGKGAVDA